MSLGAFRYFQTYIKYVLLKKFCLELIVFFKNGRFLTSAAPERTPPPNKRRMKSIENQKSAPALIRVNTVGKKKIVVRSSLNQSKI